MPNDDDDSQRGHHRITASLGEICSFYISELCYPKAVISQYRSVIAKSRQIFHYMHEEKLERQGLST